MVLIVLIFESYTVENLLDDVFMVFHVPQTQITYFTFYSKIQLDYDDVSQQQCILRTQAN